ncbi:MAG: HAD-IIB family hydrolase [Brooklawnia sp.]|jgi:Cof subfamily protein (haloacid dehalogenase superfamily)
MHGFDLIATDLDGTFLDNDQRVPELNARAVRRAAELGIETVYATGRPTRWLGILRHLPETHGWAVAANGAVTLDLVEGRVVHSRHLPERITAQIAAEIRDRLPNSIFAVEYVESWGAEPVYEAVSPHLEPTHRGPVAELFAREHVVKLLVIDPTMPTEVLNEVVCQVVGDRLTVTFSYVSDIGMLEISAPGVSKALALAELLADLGIPAARMIAFGDMPNDLAMLGLAGQGFAMAGAHPSLLTAGHPSAGDNNLGGVGRTILRLLGEGS